MAAMRITNNQLQRKISSLNNLLPLLEQIAGSGHPHAGYGGTFSRWLLSSEPEPYNSWGNGAAMQDAIRNAISLGGDSDTLACITGAIAEGYHGPVSQTIMAKVKECLTADLWSITEQFRHRYDQTLT